MVESFEMENKKEIPELPEKWKDYQKFLKEVSKKKCDCQVCKLFKSICRDFSRQELESCLRNFLIECSYEIPKYPSYLG